MPGPRRLQALAPRPDRALQSRGQTRPARLGENPEGTGIDAIAVDEQCVYCAQYAKSGDYFTVFARAKPE
ncbi:MAG: hypothetical protein JW940_08325 [Polyangiaceae bacterium]|nr:hypothetical protein [Polyangiaceae bacterium]